MTLMAGPVDTRINPTKVNELATSKPIDWFERNLIARVPHAIRRRAPARLSRLRAAHRLHVDEPRPALQCASGAARAPCQGEIEKAEAIKKFYDEYFAVLDLPAEFYLETVSWVFQESRLPKGELMFKGGSVDLKAIRQTALLTVEGERDDICALGQTAAAHELCSSLRPHMKRHHMQTGVGHYGVFSGRRWEGQIYPLVRNMILAMD